MEKLSSGHLYHNRTDVELPDKASFSYQPWISIHQRTAFEGFRITPLRSLEIGTTFSEIQSEQIRTVAL
jgi:hypothetical protein